MSQSESEKATPWGGCQESNGVEAEFDSDSRLVGMAQGRPLRSFFLVDCQPKTSQASCEATPGGFFWYNDPMSKKKLSEHAKRLHTRRCDWCGVVRFSEWEAVLICSSENRACPDGRHPSLADLCWLWKCGECVYAEDSRHG